MSTSARTDRTLPSLIVVQNWHEELKRLGPYEVTAQIGVGGMGEVYRARDTKLDRDIAIKVLPASLAGDPGTDCPLPARSQRPSPAE